MRVAASHRRGPLRRPAVLAGAALAAVVALAAGAAVGAGGGSDALARAAARVEGESVRARVDFRVTSGEGTYGISGTGDFDATRGAMTARIVEADEERLPARFVIVGDEVWMQATDEALPAGKEWRHAFDPGSPETILPPTLAGFLADAEDVEEVGEELMLGTRATRYRAELDVSSLAERDDAAERLETIAGGDDVRLPLEVWITPEGRPLLLRTSYASAQRSMKVEVAYLEFGVDVEAEPPPNDVVEEDP